MVSDVPGGRHFLDHGSSMCVLAQISGFAPMTHDLGADGRRAGRASGVIDFGDITSGDPACDLGVAWIRRGPIAASYRSYSKKFALTYVPLCAYVLHGIVRRGRHHQGAK
jgi:hypothetical protein